MLNPDLYRWLRDLANDPNFQECTSLTDRALEEQYDIDLVLRFVILRSMKSERLSQVGDINDFLTETMIEIAQKNDIDKEVEERAFRATFSILYEKLGNDGLHKYDTSKQKFVGGFLVSAFEVVALGIGFNYDKIPDSNIDLRDTIKEIWEDPFFISSSGSGIRASSRLPKTIPLGREKFNP